MTADKKQRKRQVIMLKAKILDAIQKLDYSGCELTDEQIEKLYEDVCDILEMDGYEQEIEIVDALPQHIRLVYLIRELSATICCDGFLSVYYNRTGYEIRQLIDNVKIAGLSDLLVYLEKAQQLILTKFSWPNDDDNLIAQFGDDNPYDAIGEEICDQIESMEQEVEDLICDEEFWKRVEVVWNSMEK